MNTHTTSLNLRARTSKGLLAALMALALFAVAGCQSTRGTHVSTAGGVVPLDEGFTITVPVMTTIKQGTTGEVKILLNRGAYFKTNVRLDVRTEGISVTPTTTLIRAGDVPEVRVQIIVDRSAALGEYRVTVSGTPDTGTSTATVFVVKVVS